MLKTNEPVLNAFQAVRPRGENLPPAAPRPSNKGSAPLALKGSLVRALDRNGKPCVPLKPRAISLVIEGREAAAASHARRDALRRGGL